MSRRRVCRSPSCPGDHISLRRSVAVEASEGCVLRPGRLRVSPRGSSFKCEGGGKPAKVCLFNEAMALHEAGVDGVVHEVVGMYRARVDGTVHGLLAWLGSPDHA